MYQGRFKVAQGRVGPLGSDRSKSDQGRVGSLKVGSRSGRIARVGSLKLRIASVSLPTPPQHVFAVKCVARDGLARGCLHLPSEPRDAANNRLANSSSFTVSLMAFSLSLTNLVKSILGVSMSSRPGAPM